MLLRMGRRWRTRSHVDPRAAGARYRLAEQVIAKTTPSTRWSSRSTNTIELIAKMQPAAVDLRFVATVMKITPELERIADLAGDVCERAIELNREPALKPLVNMPRLARIAQEMVREALDAFVRRDAAAGARVIARDDEVDQLTEHLVPRAARPTCSRTRGTSRAPSASPSSGSTSSGWPTAPRTSARWSCIWSRGR